MDVDQLKSLSDILSFWCEELNDDINSQLEP